MKSVPIFHQYYFISLVLFLRHVDFSFLPFFTYRNSHAKDTHIKVTRFAFSVSCFIFHTPTYGLWIYRRKIGTECSLRSAPHLTSNSLDMSLLTVTGGSLVLHAKTSASMHTRSDGRAI